MSEKTAREAQAIARGETELEQRPAYWTYDDSIGHHLYYFAPTNHAAPPYKTQRRVTAIIDIADDGTLAGVELIYDMPPPPKDKKKPRKPGLSQIQEESPHGLG